MMGDISTAKNLYRDDYRKHQNERQTHQIVQHHKRSLMLALRRPVTTVTPITVNTETEHITICDPIIALLASGVTTNSVTASIISNAVKL